MSFKAKTVLDKDIRVFKQDIDNMANAFEAITNFIKEKYEIKGGFSIQYEDEEKDLITISSSDDLEEAYSQAEANGVVLKLLVVPDEKSAPVYSFTTEVDRSQVNGEESFSSSSDDDEEKKQVPPNEEEKAEECVGKKLLNDLINNKEFREEFVKFISTFMKTLQQDINKISQDVFQQTLLNHQQVNQHPAMQKMAELFPILLHQFQPFLALIFNFDVDNVASWINQIIDMCGNCENNNGFGNFFEGLQPLMHMFGIPVPPPASCHGFTPFGVPPQGPFGFGYGYGFPHAPHGPHHGPHAHHHRNHGPHAHPPPPFGSFHGFHGHHGHNHNHSNQHHPNAHGYPPMFGFGPFGRPRKFHGCPMKDKTFKCKWQKHCGGNKHTNKEIDNEYSVSIIKDDVTLPDKAYVLPGQVIVKTWRVKNDGKKDWPNGIKIKYNGKAFNPIVNGVEYDVPSLKINEEGDISIMMETPKEIQDNTNGKQKSNWKLFLPNGKRFGPIFRVRVFVVNEQEDNKPQACEMPIVQEEKKQEDDELVAIQVQIPIQTSIEEQVSEQVPIVQDEKAKEKLLKEKNKLEKKVAKLDAKLAKQEKKNKKEDDKEMMQDQSSSFSEIEAPPVIEEFEMDINDDEPANVIENNINHVEPYPYEQQLNTLIGMGFDDVEKIRNLLDASKGDVNAVINQLF